MKKKSVVLSDTEKNSNKKAVLSLEEDGVGIRGTLRLYNFAHDLTGISSLGFYVNQKVYKAGLTYKSRMFYEFFIDLKEIPNKFSCAVVNFQNAEASPILYGSSEGSDDEIYGSIITEISKDGSYKNAQKVLDKYDVQLEDDEKQIVEKEIDEAICEGCGNCADCVYKKFFYENIDQKNAKNEVFSQKTTNFNEEDSKNKDKQFQEDLQGWEQNDKTEQNEQAQERDVFIDKLKPQIDKLFENYPIETNLQRIIPSSKWVKVEYEDDGDFYVFGLLYDEDENIKYVCYGVPAIFEEEPPRELVGYPIWLPLDKDNAKGFGYWLTYQDASTGEPVKAIID